MRTFLHTIKPSSEKAKTPTGQVSKAMVPSFAPTVVELFQSQGCSSCPPTNANVLRLLHDPKLLILTYHVTYWDRLGWKDTFGSPAFDKRQWEYARALQRKTVYTPQAIVNGQVEGVGNSGGGLQSLITLGNEFSATNTVDVAYPGHGQVITVSGPRTEHGLVMVIDYVSKSVEVRILHGENRNRTLPHNNIVRDWTPIGTWSGGSQDFVLPEKHNEAGLKRAVLVSAGSGGLILGAACILRQNYFVVE